MSGSTPLWEREEMRRSLALFAASALAVGVVPASAGADPPGPSGSPAGGSGISADPETGAPPTGGAQTFGTQTSGPQTGGGATLASSEALQMLDAPRRILDTRRGGSTVDGRQAGEGRPDASDTVTLTVAGRAGVPADADSAVLNVTAVDAAEQGFVTVFPCGADRPNASSLNVAADGTVAVAVIAGLGDDGAVCLFTSTSADLVVDLAGHLPAGAIDALDAPARLLDTREASATDDGRFERIGAREAGSTLELDVAGRAGLGADVDAVVLTVTVDSGDDAGYVTVHPCDGDRPIASSLNHADGATVANTVVTRLDPDGRACLYTSADTHLIVDVSASVPSSTYTALDQPRRLLDTRSANSTVDGRFAGIGMRPQRSTLALDVAGRAGVPSDAGAVLVNLTSVGARGPGYATVHPGGSDRPNASNINVPGGTDVANAVVTRLGADGSVCLFADAGAHFVVDVVGWFPGVEPAEGEGCPAPPLFPTYRMVALYGTDADSRMGALGEQSPEQAAERLAEVLAPYEAGDRPVLGVFELIITVALASPGPDGLYRSVSPAERVERWLEVARRHGYHVVLDIQPGRSDFLTEVRRYERFLREPDVHVALDPEWRMGPNEVPGQLVGQVSAAEVNEVSRYLAEIVREEGLPQKLLIVHQFQDRMITQRDDLIAPPELAVNIHMDGFGTREEKLNTYSITRVDPPLWNGFKLFYDEDIEMFSPAEVLELDPVPDFISYQ